MDETVAIDYVTLDVFTDRAFGGNPLAVVLDARPLTGDEMQAIAAEFNYSETTFLLPPRDARATARVRIFTPARELPFAGHPNVGTAFVVAGRGEIFGRPAGDVLFFEETAGLVPLAIIKENGVIAGALLTAPQPLSVGPPVAPAIVAECVGLAPEAIATEGGAPVVASVGLPFLFAALKGRESLARCRVDAASCARHLPGLGTDAIHLSVREGRGVAARVFAYQGRIFEDAATGSANLALAALAAERMAERDAELALEITQGVEMGRPSKLSARAIKRGGKVQRAEIAGSCVEIMRGGLTFTRRPGA
ncbi:MAG: PhzF family phenazine biosynthesis protein [Acetobacteraceae bacterium]